MRVAAWNIGWNRSKSQVQTMWSVLREEICADVALLQESGLPEAESFVWSPIEGLRWGSAVVGLTVAVDEIVEARGRANTSKRALTHTIPGSVVVATADTGQAALTLISVYGVIAGGYADAMVNKQLSDLVPLLDDREHEGRVVLGGDLNITTQWTGSQKRYRAPSLATFQRIKALGLEDCLDRFRNPVPLEGCNCADGDQCRHIQTQRHRASRRPWQNDYLFASNTLVSKGYLRQAWVHDSEAIRNLGDHLPLVADFDFGSD